MVNVVSESRFTDIRSRSGIEIAQGLLDSPGHTILVIILAAFKDVQRLLVNLPADAVPVGARRRQQKPQRLLPGVAGALGHDVIQGPGRLGMQLIEDAG